MHIVGGNPRGAPRSWQLLLSMSCNLIFVFWHRANYQMIEVLCKYAAGCDVIWYARMEACLLGRPQDA